MAINIYMVVLFLEIIFECIILLARYIFCNINVIHFFPQKIKLIHLPVEGAILKIVFESFKSFSFPIKRLYKKNKVTTKQITPSAFNATLLRIH